MRGRARAVGPRRVARLTCHCVDCQTFALYLQDQGHAGLLLDAWGGTEVTQMPPARIEIEAGADKLACVRLSDTGLMRWYASCCHTPIANTLPNAKMPFTGVIMSFVGPEVSAPERDELLGPVGARVNGRPRPDDPSAPKFPKFPAGTIWRSIRILLGGWIRGEQWPTPFYDADGQPKATPTVLSENEREQLRARAQA